MQNNDSIKKLYSNELMLEYQKYAPAILERLWNGDDDKRLSTTLALDSDTITAEQARDLLLNHDCVLISACRAVHEETYEQDIKRNEENTRQLEQALKDIHLQYIIVDGCYREKFEDEASHEVSFFVYENPSRGTEFFQRMYSLSEYYLQDSFLHIAAGMTWRAYEIFTNDDTRSDDQKFRLCGKLKLNLPPVGPYTEFKRGVMKFVMDEDEELKDRSIKMFPTKSRMQNAKKMKFVRKRFDSVEAGRIVLGHDGNVWIGRYSVGLWYKTNSGYVARLNYHRLDVAADTMKELRNVIVFACKQGVTGKSK